MRPPDSLVVVLIEVPAESIVQRLSSRRVCDVCGITQSISHEGGDREPCPYCGGNLVRRPDDNPDTIRRRLAAYAEISDPVVAYYRRRRGFGAPDLQDAVCLARSWHGTGCGAAGNRPHRR